METYAEAKPLVHNPHFQAQRRSCLAGLSDQMLDAPIIDVIHAINKLPYAFTLQCCYGHFVYPGRHDPQNLEPLPKSDAIACVEYRIAYVALCIENSQLGRQFLSAVEGIPRLDPHNIQLCSAEWFWDRQLNSYALQVEPERFKTQDTAMLAYEEALEIENVRERFWYELKKLLQNQPLAGAAG